MVISCPMSLSNRGRINMAEPIIGDHFTRDIEDEAPQRVSNVGVRLHAPVSLIEIFIDRIFDSDGCFFFLRGLVCEETHIRPQFCSNHNIWYSCFFKKYNILCLEIWWIFLRCRKKGEMNISFIDSGFVEIRAFGSWGIFGVDCKFCIKMPSTSPKNGRVSQDFLREGFVEAIVNFVLTT